MIPGDRERDSYCETIERVHEVCRRRGLSFMAEMGAMAQMFLALEGTVELGEVSTVAAAIARDGIAPGVVTIEQLEPTRPYTGGGRHGLTRAERVRAALADGEPMTASEVAKKLGDKSSAISSTLHAISDELIKHKSKNEPTRYTLRRSG